MKRKFDESTVWAGRSAALLLARILSKTFTLVYTVAIARSLGEHQFGVFSATMVLCSLAGVLAEAGLLLPTIRDVSRDKDLYHAVSETIAPRIVASFVGLSVVFAVSILQAVSWHLVLAIGTFSLFESATSFFVRAYEGRGNVARMTVLMVIERSILTLMLFGSILFLPGSLFAIGICFALGEMVSLLIAGFPHLRWLLMNGIEFSWIEVRGQLARGFPFLVPALLGFFCYRADVAILAGQRPYAEVGQYSAAMRVVEAYMFVPMSMMAMIFPKMSHAYQQKPARLAQLLRNTAIVFLIVGIVACLAVFLGSERIVRLLYQDHYAGAVGLLRILSLAFVSYTVNFFLSQALVAMNKERLYALVMGAGSVVSTAGVLVFAGTYGAAAAAWARLAAESTMTLGFLVFFLNRWRAIEDTSLLSAK